MAVEFFDVMHEPELEAGHSKKVLFSSDHFHTWIHGDYPGTKGPMHRHTADQIFYCAQGECTFTFPDGTRKALKAGHVVVVPKGEFYELENTGDEYMILLGCRAEPNKKPRFGLNEEEVGANTWALENR